MATEHLLTIVLIISSFIAQLIAPSIAVLVASRSNQPKPAPEPNQPKTRIQRIGGWLMRFLTSPRRFKRLQNAVAVSPLFAMLLPVYFLRKYLLDSAPITRSAVFIISLCVTLIWFSFLNFILNVSLFWGVWPAIRDQTKQFEKVVDVVSGLSDSMNTLADTQSAMSKTLELTQLSQTEPDKPTQGRLGMLLAAIRNLFGG